MFLNINVYAHSIGILFKLLLFYLQLIDVEEVYGDYYEIVRMLYSHKEQLQ